MRVEAATEKRHAFATSSAHAEAAARASRRGAVHLERCRSGSPPRGRPSDGVGCRVRDQPREPRLEHERLGPSAITPTLGEESTTSL